MFDEQWKEEFIMGLEPDAEEEEFADVPDEDEEENDDTPSTSEDEEDL